MGKLVIARHHESEWNKKGLWTGSRDVQLTPYGFDKSKEMGEQVKDIKFDHAFCSSQVRTMETLLGMLSTNGSDPHIPIEQSSALNERDYGDYTGKNKWDMQKLVGMEIWEKIRRDWDYPVPNGETLKMVYERAVPYFLEKILPLLREGKNVLIVSHGNTIRSLMKFIEQIPDEDMGKIEMLFGGILIYDVDEEGHMKDKIVRHVESRVIHA